MLSCVDPATEARMKEEVEEVSRTGDTVGGVFEVVVHGAPAGLGTYANWDERLDGLLAWSVMSLQAVKAVEIGRGVTAAESFGSKVHDPIHYASARLPAGPPALRARTTTRAALRAAFRTAKTSWCAAI
jgi:chorismate synthase